MDYQTHIILGLSIAFFLGGGRLRDRELAFFVGVAAPDLEIVLDPLADATGILYFRHRAFPHSPIMAPIWTALILFAFSKAFKAPSKVSREALLWALAGTYLSILLDAITGAVPLYPLRLWVGLVAYTFEDTFVFTVNLVLFPILVVQALRSRSVFRWDEMLNSGHVLSFLRRVWKAYILLILVTVAFHVGASLALRGSAPADMTTYRVRTGAYCDWEWYVIQKNETHVRVIRYDILSGRREAFTYPIISGAPPDVAERLIQLAKEKDSLFRYFASSKFSVFTIVAVNSTHYNVTVVNVELKHIVTPYYRYIWPFVLGRYRGYRRSIIIALEEA